MADETVLGSWSLPFSDPQFVFANAQAFAAFLNNRERTKGEIIQSFGVYNDPVSEKPAGHFYDYLPVEVGETGPAQPLSILPVSSPWDAFVDANVDAFEFIDHANIIFGGAVSPPVEVVLLRALEHPITVAANGVLTTTAPGWQWLTPEIQGKDLVVRTAKCTWFGGPHDSEDNGETASGKVNTRRQTDFRGCALPMSGFRNSRNTKGSPLPRFKWLTPVEVTCLDADLADRKLTVELIDLGPSGATQHAVDLTEPAFNAVGAASSRGVIQVDFRILNWRDHLESGATFSEIPASSSEQKPMDAQNQKVRAPLNLPAAFNQAAFTAFVQSLGLRFISAAELLPYFANVRNGVSNQPPVPALWPNFAPTLMVIDALRASLGSPVHLVSTYRFPVYNRQLDGAAALSQHMAFRAADIQVAGKTPPQVHDALRALRGTRLEIPAGAQFAASAMTNSGNGVDSDTPFNLAGLQLQNPSIGTKGSFVFEGGLGLYQTFVHVDCRGIHQDW